MTEIDEKLEIICLNDIKRQLPIKNEGRITALEGEIGMDGIENRGRIEVLEAEVLELKKIVATLLGVN